MSESGPNFFVGTVLTASGGGCEVVAPSGEIVNAEIDRGNGCVEDGEIVHVRIRKSGQLAIAKLALFFAESVKARAEVESALSHAERIYQECEQARLQAAANGERICETKQDGCG